MILVAGAGGFIGGHLVKALLTRGEFVRAADIKPLGEWWQLHPDAQNHVIDLRQPLPRPRPDHGVDAVYNLACNMGGMGFIESNKAECMLNVLVSTNLIQAAHLAGVSRYFYASTACVYPQHLQRGCAVALRESDVYPADCEDGYGWEKLFSERMCRHFHEDYGLETRVGRFHTTYGPHGTWQGGREKVPAALCRKVALAKLTGGHEIDVWGDGKQERSGLFVADAVDAVLRLTESDHAEPLNIGGTEVFTVDGLLSLVERIAGVKPLRRVYDPFAPQGVRGRSSDNTRMCEATGWEPTTTLADGMERTYAWVEDQVRASLSTSRSGIASGISGG